MINKNNNQYKQVLQSRKLLTGSDTVQKALNNNTFQGQQAFVKELINLYDESSPLGKNFLLEKLGADHDTITKLLSDEQKIQSVKNENNLAKVFSMEGISSNALKSDTEEQKEEQRKKYMKIAYKLSGAAGAFTLAVLANKQVSGTLDGEMAFNMLLILVTVEASIIALGLLADAVSLCSDLCKKTPEDEASQDREKLSQLHANIIQNPADSKKVSTSLTEASKIMQKYGERDEAAQKTYTEINNINYTLQQSIHNKQDILNNYKKIITDLVREQELVAANQSEHNTHDAQPQDADMDYEDLTLSESDSLPPMSPPVYTRKKMLPPGMSK